MEYDEATLRESDDVRFGHVLQYRFDVPRFSSAGRQIGAPRELHLRMVPLDILPCAHAEYANQGVSQ